MNAMPACLAVVAAVLLAARGARATHCAANEYDDAGTCMACYTGSTSPAGSDSADDCVCVAGFYIASVCNDLPANHDPSIEWHDGYNCGQDFVEGSSYNTYNCAFYVTGGYCQLLGNVDYCAGTECMGYECYPGIGKAVDNCCGCGGGNTTFTCSVCPEGTYSSSVASTTCTTCPVGGVVNSARTVCECPAGQTGSPPDCVDCAAGTYKTSPGSGACTPCAEGTTSNAARTECVCGPGKEPDGAGGCDLCPPNHYKSSYTDDACLECRHASATDSTGTDADYLCKCIPGYYNSDSQTNDCEECDAGTYKSTSANLEACLACPTGSTTLTTANDELSDCICDLGYTGTGGGSCVACAVGEYKASTGSATCTTCPTGSTSPEASETSTDCVCESPAYTGDAGGPCYCSPGYFLQNAPSNWKFESRTPYLELSDGQATGNLGYLGSKNLGSSIVVVSSSIPTSEGILWEIGGAGAGGVFYVEGSVPTQYLHISAGAGDVFKTSSDDKTAIIRIPLPDSRIPQDGTIVELALIVTQPGEIKLYIDKVLIESASCTQFCHATCTGTSTYYWYGNDNAKLNGISGSVVVNNLQSTSWQGSISGTLKFYEQDEMFEPYGIYFDMVEECHPCPAGNYCPGGRWGGSTSCPALHSSAALSANETDCLCGIGSTCAPGAACVGAPTCTDPVSFPVYGEYFFHNQYAFTSQEIRDTYADAWNLRAGKHIEEFIKFMDKDGWSYKGWKIPMGDTDGTTQLDDWVLAAYGGYPTEICNNPMDNLPCYITADVSESNGWECQIDGFPISQPSESCPYQGAGADDMRADVCIGALSYFPGCQSGRGELATDPITGAGPRDYFFDVHILTSVDAYNQELGCKSTNAVLRIFGRNWYPFGVLVSKDDIWSFLNPDTNPYIDAFYEYEVIEGECVKREYGSLKTDLPSWASTAVHIFSGPNCQDTSVCEVCGANTYKGVEGGQACTPCPDNTQSPTASTSLSDCIANAGFYFDASQNNIGMACPSGMTSAVGSTSVSDCGCDYGHTGPNCVACEAGKYKDVLGSSDCLSCRANSISPIGSDQENDCSCNLAYGIWQECTDHPRNDNPAFTWTDRQGATCEIYGNGGNFGWATLGPHCSNGAVLPEFVPELDGSKIWMVTGGYYDSNGVPDGAVSACCACGGGAMGAYQCVLCEAGQYKDSVADTECSNCPLNSFSLPASDNSTDCKCNAGYTGPDGGDCVACEAGKYKSVTGSSDCLSCPANSTSPTASLFQWACVCQAGFAGENGTPCTICPENQYEDMTTHTCVECAANTVSPVGSDSEQDCECKAGFYLDSGSSNCVACSANTFKPSVGPEDCTDCPAHSESPEGSVNADECLCAAGYFMNDGLCDPCDVGTYTDTVGNDVCSLCPGNSTTAGTGSTSVSDCACNPGYSGENGDDCTICPSNTYKDIATNTCTNCPDNTVSNEGSFDVTACKCTYDFTGPDGGVCSACADATYKNSIGSELCSDCPDDSVCFYSVSTSSTQITCNAGYTTNTGNAFRRRLLSSNECQACPIGTYKPTPGSDACLDCPDNSISSIGSTDVSGCKCNAGYTGSDGGACSQCVPNTYKNITGSSDCLACTDKSTSPSGSDSADDCICDSGYLSAGDGSCDLVCAAGFEGNSDESLCVGCGNSHYKPTQGLESCTPCPTFSSHSLYNQTSIESCVCQHGYVFNAGTSACDACVAGKFNNYGGETVCFDCYSDTSGTCISSSDSDTQSCTDICQAPPGYQITQSNLEVCPSNTYNDGSFTTCQTCPTGSYTLGMGSIAVTDCVCQAGYFRNSNSLCEACAIGTFKSTQGDATCLACPTDMTTLTMNSTSCVCAAGFEPNTENTACQPCGSNQAKFVVGNMSCIQCTDHATLQSDLPHQPSSCLCDPGYTGTHVECSACELGTYKNAHGSHECTSCGDNQQTQNVASTSVSDCTSSFCTIGTFFSGGTCQPCVPGSYKNTSSSAECTPCPAPYVTSIEGATSDDDCNCGPGQMGKWHNMVTITQLLGFRESDYESYTCTGMPCSHSLQSLYPIKDVTFNSVPDSIQVTVKKNATSLLVFRCDNAIMCAGVYSVDLGGIRADYVEISSSGISAADINVRTYTRTMLTYSSLDSDSSWIVESILENFVTTNRPRVGDTILRNTVTSEAETCLSCAQGLVCL